MLKHFAKKIHNYINNIRIIKHIDTKNAKSLYAEYILNKFFGSCLSKSNKKQKIYVHYASMDREFKTIIYAQVNDVSKICREIATNKQQYNSFNCDNTKTITKIYIVHDNKNVTLMPFIKDFIKYNCNITFGDILMANNIEFNNDDKLYIEYFDNLLDEYTIKKDVKHYWGININNFV